MKLASCDLFCTVVDNYGDIGVCWRLARQLAHEHGLAVRLWVDDLASFQRLCPGLDPEREVQTLRGIEIRHWHAPFLDVTPADLVIAAFACKLPENYVAAMAARAPQPVWINLEYLSAEAWVEQCHRLPSPHARLPLTKHFFFPGFTPATGGLLLERGLFARRDAFQQDESAQTAYWQALGLPPRLPDELRVSLFCYENPALDELLALWRVSSRPITLLVPEGRILPQLARFSGRPLQSGDHLQHGALRLYILPFVPQEDYDLLLWACDLNFVRGEDSCVRAQWAARPFVWHIYPQHDGVHLSKLRALAQRYGTALPPAAARANQDFWLAWNGIGSAAATWPAFLEQLPVLRAHGQDWAQSLSSNDLALNLLDFCRQVA